jgi:hypothetical protein
MDEVARDYSPAAALRGEGIQWTRGESSSRRRRENGVWEGNVLPHFAFVVDDRRRSLVAGTQPVVWDEWRLRENLTHGSSLLSTTKGEHWLPVHSPSSGTNGNC